MKINRQIARTDGTLITTIKQIVAKCGSHCSHGPAGRTSSYVDSSSAEINRPQAGGYNEPFLYALS